MEKRPHLVERNRTPVVAPKCGATSLTLIEWIPLAFPEHHPAVFGPMAHEWLKVLEVGFLLSRELACGDQNYDECKNSSWASHNCSFDQIPVQQPFEDHDPLKGRVYRRLPSATVFLKYYLQFRREYTTPVDSGKCKLTDWVSVRSGGKMNRITTFMALAILLSFAVIVLVDHWTGFSCSDTE
jgi:hypothetical protein